MGPTGTVNGKDRNEGLARQLSRCTEEALPCPLVKLSPAEESPSIWWNPKPDRVERAGAGPRTEEDQDYIAWVVVLGNARLAAERPPCASTILKDTLLQQHVQFLNLPVFDF